MTTRRTLLASLFSFPLSAADFWQAKKSSEWSDKELGKILHDSPWSRSTAVTTGKSNKGGGGGGGNARAGNTGGNSRSGGGMNTGGMGGTGRGGAGAGGMGGGGNRDVDRAPSGTSSASLQIRWASAKPVKIAVARLKFGAEAETKPEVMELVNREEKEYRILVEGIPPNLARQGAEKLASSLKRNCAIHCAGKGDLTPTDAQAVQGDRGLAIVLTFPKSDPFSLDDKEVEFAMKLGNNPVKRKFKLKEMVFEGKLEL